MLKHGRICWKPYAPEGVDRILPEFKDSDGTFLPGSASTHGRRLGSSTRKCSKAHGIDTVPTSYQDLLDPKYKGLIAMSNPASSGTGLLTVNGILTSLRGGRGMGLSGSAGRKCGRLYALRQHSLRKSTAAGEYGIGVSFGYRCLQSAEEVGSDICEAVFPEEGSGWDMEANALIKKDGNEKRSRERRSWTGRFPTISWTKYATNYPIVATGVGDDIPEGYSYQSAGSADSGHRF